MQIIQRDQENPFVFFRVGVRRGVTIQVEDLSHHQLNHKLISFLQIEKQTAQCFTGSNEILLQARKLIQINLVTFSMLVCMLPQNIIHIIYFGHPGNEELEKILAIVGYFQLPFIVLFPFLIYKKLDK